MEGYMKKLGRIINKFRRNNTGLETLEIAIISVGIALLVSMAVVIYGRTNNTGTKSNELVDTMIIPGAPGWNTK